MHVINFGGWLIRSCSMKFHLDFSLHVIDFGGWLTQPCLKRFDHHLEDGVGLIESSAVLKAQSDVSNAADSVAYFKAMALEYGVNQPLINALSASGVQTMGHLAFAMSRPGKDRDLMIG